MHRLSGGEGGCRVVWGGGRGGASLMHGLSGEEGGHH